MAETRVSDLSPTSYKNSPKSAKSPQSPQSPYKYTQRHTKTELASRKLERGALRGRASKVSVEFLNISGYYLYGTHAHSVRCTSRSITCPPSSVALILHFTFQI